MAVPNTYTYDEFRSGRDIALESERRAAGPAQPSPAAEGAPFHIRTRPDWVRRDQAELTRQLEDDLKHRRPIHFLPNDVYEGKRYVGGRELYVLRLFGILKNGAKAELTLTDTSLDFDVRLRTEELERVLDEIESRSTSASVSPAAASPPDERAKLLAARRKVLVEESITQIKNELDEANIDFMDAWHVEAFPQREVHDEPVDWCRIRFSRLKERKDAIKLLENRYELASDDFSNYFRKVARDENISLAEWNLVSNYDARPGGGTPQKLVGEIDFRDPSPLCEWVIEAKCENVKPIIDPLVDRATYLQQIQAKREDPLLTRDRTLLLTYDIETYGETQLGGPPDPFRKDTEVFMICATLHWKDEAEPLLKVEITRTDLEIAGAARPPDWVKLACGDEAEVILCFARLLRRLAPDLILDFNGMQYDWPFIVEKARKHDVLGVFFDEISAARFSVRPQTTDNVLKWNYRDEQKVKMPNGSRHLISFLKAPGFVPLDMRVMFMKLYAKAEVTRGESLNFYLKINGLELKYDLPIALMRKHWEAQDPDGIREIAEYCIIDSLSCQRLQVRRNIINDARRLSALTFCALFDSFYYANGMKVCNKLVAHARHQFNMLYPNRTNDSGEKGKKPGAFVFQPERGLHCDFPIAGEDAGSLYPSIYIVYNLSLEKYLPTQEAVERYLKRHPEYRDKWGVHHSNFVFNGRERNGWFIRHMNDVEKMGLFPRILLDLFNMRKDMKVELAKFEHRKEELEGLMDAEGNLPPELQREYDDVVFNFSAIDAEQKAFKVFMNTFYGETGNPDSPVYLAELSAGVTSAGKRIIQKVADMTVKDGHKIIYGDTDSIYPKFAYRYFKKVAGEYRDDKARFVKRWRKRQLKLLEEKQAEELKKLGKDADRTDMVARHAEERTALEAEEYAGAKGLIAAKEEYWSRLVEQAFVAAEELKQKINIFVREDNGTVYLGFAYEEVLFPMVSAGKKKYWGIPHVGRPNFRPKKLFIRGIDIIKQGQTDFAKEIGMRIMWESVSLERPPERNILMITHDVMRDAINRPSQWKFKDFVQTAEFKPDKKNPSVLRFRERMQARFREEMATNEQLEARGEPPNELRHVPPAPYERFRFVLVKLDELFQLRGTRRKLNKGDRMEFAHLIEPQGMEPIDVPFYLKSYIAGLCARFINSMPEFQGDQSGAFCAPLPTCEDDLLRDPARAELRAQLRAEPQVVSHEETDRRYKEVDSKSIANAKKALEKFIDDQSSLNPEVLRQRGFAYRRAYKKANQRVWDALADGKEQHLVRQTFGGDLDHEYFLEDGAGALFERAKELVSEMPYSPIAVAERVYKIGPRGEDIDVRQANGARQTNGAPPKSEHLYRAINLLEGRPARGRGRRNVRVPTLRGLYEKRAREAERVITETAPRIRAHAAHFEHALVRSVIEERESEHEQHANLGTEAERPRDLGAANDPGATSEPGSSALRFSEEELAELREFRKVWLEYLATLSLEHQQRSLLEYLRQLRDKRGKVVRQPSREEVNLRVSQDLAKLRRTTQ